MNIPLSLYHHPSRRRVLKWLCNRRPARRRSQHTAFDRRICRRRRWMAGRGVQAKTEADALKSLFGKSAEASDKVKLDAPEIAENGAVVPISISTSLPNVTSISVLVHENPYALAASYKIPEGTIPAVSNRLKMAKTSNVVAIVESDGKLYSASKEVKVTVGGCGG